MWIISVCRVIIRAQVKIPVSPKDSNKSVPVGQDQKHEARIKKHKRLDSPTRSLVQGTWYLCTGANPEKPGLTLGGDTPEGYDLVCCQMLIDNV
jgi:hypothetical protein